jgi:hypothetical protein
LPSLQGVLNEAPVVIIVPADAATSISIHGERDTMMAEIDFARFRTMEKEGEYQSMDYESASKRVDIQIDGHMNSIKIV